LLQSERRSCLPTPVWLYYCGGLINTDLAQKYWKLENAIVAFSVLQMLAFLYALAGKEFRRQVEEHYRFVQIGIFAGSVTYLIGVICCYYIELDLRGSTIDPNVTVFCGKRFGPESS